MRALIAKLDLCARLHVYAYEADSEGHYVSASTFHELGNAERRLFDELLESLRRHLNEAHEVDVAGR